MSNTKHSGKPPSTGQGMRLAAFISLGFRPFFLGAALFAGLAIGLWVLDLHGFSLIAPGYGMTTWHMHEMLFGYGPAVLSGFLLTAVPNWTGRKPLTGRGLMALWLLWLTGRVVMMTAVPQPVMAVVDIAFLPAIGLVLAREITASRNWRNLMVLGPIILFALANAIFHFEVDLAGRAEYGTRLGLAALVFLVMLIGGRVVPAFTRNWLVKHGSDRRPVGFSRFDGVTMLVSGAALILWVVMPVGAVTGGALAVIAVLHGVRLARWAGLATRSDPLLFVLHVAYAMIPAGLALLALGAALESTVESVAAQVAGLHLLGIGAIGGMTMSVMMRASLGHTGQALKADRWLVSGLVFIFLAAGFRVLAQFAADQTMWIDLSAALWIAGFALFVLRIGPSLLTPRPGSGQA